MPKRTSANTHLEHEPLLPPDPIKVPVPVITVNGCKNTDAFARNLRLQPELSTPSPHLISDKNTTESNIYRKSATIKCDVNLKAVEVYRNSNEGKIDIGDVEWTTKLRSAIFANDFDVCEALLCCGIPVTSSVLNEIPPESTAIRSLCGKFYPDIWTAVRTGNVKQIRCLVNLWHSVNLVQEGRPLFQVAIEHCNPYIISLIGGIQATMEVAHLVLAGDVDRLRAVRSGGQCIKRTLKHFGHNCAPILYFAIIQHNSDLVEELCVNFGMKADEEMLDEIGEEIPLLFVAVKSAVKEEILRILIKSINRPVNNIWYQAKNILQYAVDIKVSVECFRELLQHGGARLVAERDIFNRSILHLMVDEEQEKERSSEFFKSWRRTLERQIRAWIEESGTEAGWLAVSGLVFPTNENCDWGDELARVQKHISDMNECIEINDIDRFCELLKQETSRFEDWPNAIWFGHPPDNGQTLLHRAVIRNRKEIIELILLHMKMNDIPLDNFGASALHYACAESESTDVERTLLCLGFGEHYVDKAGRDCASYRMKRDTPEMRRYLDALAQGDCKKAALADPWRIPAEIESADETKEQSPSGKRLLNPASPGDKSCPHHKSVEHLRRESDSRSLGVAPDTWCSIV